MSELKFVCSNCHQRLECDSGLAGQEIECPTCRFRVMVPSPELSPASGHSSRGEIAEHQQGAGTLAVERKPASASGGPLSDARETMSFDLFTAPKEAELRAFVGRNADYYLEKWSSALVSNRQTGRAGYNWAAFLIAGFWLPYRKLYGAAALLWAVAVLVGVGHVLAPKGKLVFSLLATPIAFGFAAAANQLYLAKARNVVKEVRARRLARQQHLAALAKRGGTSMAASVLFPLASVLAILCAFVLLDYVGLASPYGKRLSFNSGELYYLPPVSKDQAHKLGNFLVEAQVFKANRVTVQLLQSGETMQFRMIVKEGAESDPVNVEMFKRFGRELSKNVFDGKRVEMHLCDRNLKTRLTMPADE